MQDVQDRSPGEGTIPAGAGTRNRRNLTIGVLGALAGCAAGVIIASTVSAGAATSGSGSSAGSPSGTGVGTPPTSTASNTPPGPGTAYHVPGMSGTVTAVAANSVTIKTTSGTKTYAVTSSSDIDKNGEASLSDLKVGDAVTFDTETVNGTVTIGHLHAGNEALDRPAVH